MSFERVFVVAVDAIILEVILIAVVVLVDEVIRNVTIVVAPIIQYHIVFINMASLIM